MTDQSSALKELCDLLELEPLELNLFRGVSPDEERQRVFGGQVAGQALVAAGRTVDDGRRVHSLHAYFLRPGDPHVPIVYEVDRIRDGNSFTTRRVVAIQHGRAIFHLSASFHIDESGPDHQYVMPIVPPPEELPTLRERLEPHKERFSADFSLWLERERPIDSRAVEAPRWIDPRRATPNSTSGSVPTDRCPTTRCCTRASWPTRPTSPCSTPR
jgi:acyl-CoA thioesterase-2